MKHLTDEQLVWFYYGEERDRAEAEQHLAGCEQCRAAFAELERSLSAVTEAVPVPERDENYGARVWARLPLEEKRGSTGFLAWLLMPRRWAMAGAMAALVVAAFLAGRFWPHSRPDLQIARPVPPQVRERVLLVAVGDHLDRSQMVLLEIVNSKPSKEVDISDEQQSAQDLVAANRIYRQTAARSGDTGVAQVLDELERVLLEIANSPSHLSSEEFEELRKRVEAQGILFKVRVIDSRISKESARRSS
jgi:hypothetical protein